jgi:hypothetical protein
MSQLRKSSLTPSQPSLASGELQLGRPLCGRRTRKRALFQAKAVSTKPREAGEVGHLTSRQLQRPLRTPQLRTVVSRWRNRSESLAASNVRTRFACVELERDSSTSCAAKPTGHGTTSVVQQAWMSGLRWHNAGPTGYTLQHRPWRVIVSIEFPDESMAAGFERYLKSGSGRAFAKRHFSTD